jgi:hypothetical protein
MRSHSTLSSHRKIVVSGRMHVVSVCFKFVCLFRVVNDSNTKQYVRLDASRVCVESALIAGVYGAAPNLDDMHTNDSANAYSAAPRPASHYGVAPPVTKKASIYDVAPALARPSEYDVKTPEYTTAPPPAFASE